DVHEKGNRRHRKVLPAHRRSRGRKPGAGRRDREEGGVPWRQNVHRSDGSRLHVPVELPGPGRPHLGTRVSGHEGRGGNGETAGITSTLKPGPSLDRALSFNSNSCILNFIGNGKVRDELRFDADIYLLLLTISRFMENDEILNWKICN